MLVADLTVTAALSGWSALTYFGVPAQYVQISTIGIIAILGLVNFYGPRHSGSMAAALAIPMVLTVAAIICLAVPHLVPLGSLLNFHHVDPAHRHVSHYWVSFVSVILALSAVGAIANLTGVMKLDKGTTMEQPRVGRTAFKSIVVVALEVVLGTALMGWAMLSLPATIILDLSAIMGVDYLLIGASQRSTLMHLLRGSVVASVAQQLPEDFRLG